MELIEVLKKRKSCRKYSEELIDLHILNHIFRAGSRAPYASGGPRRVFGLVAKDIDKIQKACFDQEYVGSCGAIIIISGKDTDAILQSGHAKYIFDCAAACMCMDLMATSMGLGTCWIGHFDAEKVKEITKIEYRPTIILLVGYPLGDKS